MSTRSDQEAKRYQDPDWPDGWYIYQLEPGQIWRMNYRLPRMSGFRWSSTGTLNLEAAILKMQEMVDLAARR